jgi:hypothetical protein
LLSYPAAAVPAIPNKFRVQEFQIWLTGDNGESYSEALPKELGDVSAAAVSANGAAIAIAPRFGEPILLVNFIDELIKVGITLCGVRDEWMSIAFIENSTRIAATTKEGKVFVWPFYSDVRSLEMAAIDHLPLLRDENGSDKRLEVPPFILRRLGAQAT